MCSKVPTDGRIMKDCVPKQEAPSWYVHLQENADFQGCNGGHCYCDDRDGCNVASLRYNHHHHITEMVILFIFSRCLDLRCVVLIVVTLALIVFQ